MGITIHFEGRLKDEDSFERVMRAAKELAEAQSWPLSKISENMVALQRVKDEEDWDYVGPTKGIQLLPHENCEPLRLEFDKDLYIQEYIKTQFAPQEIHILVSRFLHAVEPEFVQMEVVDEGEYFETGDISMLEHHRKRFFEALDEYLAQDDKYYGPVRLPSGRIVDALERE